VDPDAGSIRAYSPHTFAAVTFPISPRITIVPTSRTPRELLLAALERRRLTGYRSSPELAWVVFPPKHDSGESVQVLHDARRRRFRVVSTQTRDFFTSDVQALGDFADSEAAAACIADALCGPARRG
jgi:hypothetical protein